MPIDHLGKRRESTALERVRIIELNAEGYSQRDIAQKMGSVSKTTVQRVLQQWKSSQLNPTPRNGRPPTLDLKDKRRIYRASDADPGATLAELTSDMHLGVNFVTVGRVLRTSGRYVRWAHRKPFISVKARSKRIK